MTRAGVGAAVVAAVVAAICVWPALAQGHGRSVSHSTWRIDGAAVSVHLELSRLDHTALANAAPEAVSRELSLQVGEAQCRVLAGSARELASSPRWSAYEWELECPPGAVGNRVLRSDLLTDTLSGHVHLARVEFLSRGVEPVEGVLSAGARELRWSGAEPRRHAIAALADMVVIGARHVLGGADHLVFLLVLVVVARRLRELGVVVTGFTLGHSVTLALAALGLASPEPAAVEALIGLSIAVVALENVWLSDGARGRAPYLAVAGLVGCAVVGGSVPRLALIGCALFAACYYAMVARAPGDARLRVVVALLFGTVHGFGFSAALPNVEMVSIGTLVGFNLGVELGQVLVLALAWPLVVLARRAGAQRALIQVSSTAAFVAGLTWFLSRGF